MEKIHALLLWSLRMKSEISKNPILKSSPKWNALTLMSTSPDVSRTSTIAAHAEKFKVIILYHDDFLDLVYKCIETNQDLLALIKGVLDRYWKKAELEGNTGLADSISSDDEERIVLSHQHIIAVQAPAHVNAAILLYLLNGDFTSGEAAVGAHQLHLCESTELNKSFYKKKAQQESVKTCQIQRHCHDGRFIQIKPLRIDGTKVYLSDQMEIDLWHSLLILPTRKRKV